MRAGAAGLVVGGLVCQEVGAATAILLFPAVGAGGMVMLRLVFSAIVLLLIARPRMRGRTRGDWLTVGAFGVAIAAMNLLFYEALSRIPLGPAVTIEVLGPLVLSVVISRRASAWLWAVLAVAGVLMLSGGGFAGLDPLGVLFAAGAGAMWVAYILCSARTGRAFAKLDGLAIAMSIGAVLSLPLGIAAAGSALLVPLNLGLGLAVAVLSSTIPYALELLALRRLPAATFSILMALAPGIAALAGLVLLAQQLAVLQWVGIGFVIVAGIGAVRAAAPRTSIAPDTA